MNKSGINVHLHSCNGSGAACTCPPGQCACEDCPKKAKSVSTCG